MLSMNPAKMTHEQIKDAIRAIDADIKKRVDAMNQIEWNGMVGGSPEHKEWLGLLKTNQELQKRRGNLQLELDDRWRKEHPYTPPTKVFVNGYGEATRRHITSPTYERALKRQEKAVLRNMGY